MEDEVRWRKWKDTTADMDLEPVQHSGPEIAGEVSTTDHPSGRVAVRAAFTPEAPHDGIPAEN